LHLGGWTICLFKAEIQKFQPSFFPSLSLVKYRFELGLFQIKSFIIFELRATLEFSIYQSIWGNFKIQKFLYVWSIFECKTKFLNWLGAFVYNEFLHTIQTMGYVVELMIKTSIMPFVLKLAWYACIIT